MPRAYDINPLNVDRDPNWSLYHGGLPNLPTIDPLDFVAGAIRAIKDLTGLDLSSPQALAQSIADFIGISPEQVLNALRSIGSFVSAIFGAIPIGLLTDRPSSLLYEGGFDDPITIAEGSTFVWDGDDGMHGTTPLGCARVDADGTHHSLASELIEVAEGWELTIGVNVKWADLVATAGAHALRINVIPYIDADTPMTGGPIMLASIESPPSHSTGPGGWRLDPMEAEWTVPAGIRYIAVELHVTDAATAGTVKFDNAFARTTHKLPQRYTRDLPEDLMSLWNGLNSLVDQILTRLGIPPVGSLLDRIFDLSDELEWIQEKAQEGALAAAQAIQDVVDLAQRLLTDPASVIGTIPQSLVSGLETTLNQIRDIFNGLVVTPVNSIVAAIKDWFDKWFGGGSTSAIPMSMRGAANGVAPLNAAAKVPTSHLSTNTANGLLQLDGDGDVPLSRLPDLSSHYIPTSQKGSPEGVAPLNANGVVPLANLPAEVGGGGGTGTGLPYAYMTASASIANNQWTAVGGGWTLSGTAPIVLDPNGFDWSFPEPGWWMIYVNTPNGFPLANTTGQRGMMLYQQGSGGISNMRAGTKLDAGPGFGGANRPLHPTLSVLVRQSESASSAWDRPGAPFRVILFQNSGSSTTANVEVMCVYMGVA